MTPRRHDATSSANDGSGAPPSADECSSAGASNPIDARLNQRLAAVSRWSALFVGALTVVLAQEVATRLPLGDTATSLALFPVSLALLYVLLTAAAHLERR
jgi:hypothetical protein